ncbi:heat shock 70 kDa protein 14 [Eupeodes corollae]|uniref:heat shock 70 kDa protein 14 n=1 Tax=Eupeodes corollae TaxID=290404 RepID=UPI002491081E|nr:heat shock 70 kDa protein 14 [Eupeodes corollae]
MWPRFGIKIGNSTLCIATVKADGNPEVIANKQGDRVSQACLLAEGNEIECGLTAKQKMSSKPASCVSNSLQFFLSQSTLTPEKIKDACKYITCYYNDSTKEFELKSKGEGDKEIVTKISPHAVCVKFFQAEFELARQSYLQEIPKPSVVLSIPNYYPLESWPSLAAAAEEAGFHVAQVVSEMTAAALAYGIGEAQADDSERKVVLCIKSGGIYSHFTLYEVTGGLYTLIEEVGPFTIGGNQYTEALVEFVCQEFFKKYRLDPKESRRSIAKIYTAATNSKHILTSLPTTQIYIDSLMDGVDFSMQMSRARFESLIQPVINKFMAVLNEAVEKLFADNQNTVTKIDEIVLLGATMKIPKIQSAITSRFPEAKIHSSYAADEVVAIGCARQATFLLDAEGQDLTDKEVCLFTPSDLHIWHNDAEDKLKVFLKKGSLLPRVVVVEVEKSKKEANNEEGEQTEIFHVKCGDTILDFSLKAAATPEGLFKIEANVDLNEDGVTSSIKLKCL